MTLKSILKEIDKRIEELERLDESNYMLFIKYRMNHDEEGMDRIIDRRRIISDELVTLKDMKREAK